MALGDLMASRFAHSSNHLDECLSRDAVELYRHSETASTSGGADANINGSVIAFSSAFAVSATTMVYLPQGNVLCELRHEAFKDLVPTGPAESGLVSKWRPKERQLYSLFDPVLLYMEHRS